MKNIAIVTGASGGLGREFVKQILETQKVDEVIAIARNKEKLDMLSSEFGDKVKPYPMDLSNVESIKAFGEYLKGEEVKISLLVNNAGFAKFCSYDDITLDESINMINLNISGVVAMGLVCIPYIPEGGHIINIASQASFQPLPYQNIYSSTKSFVRNYSRALNVELREKKICVTAVCPGWIKTPLFDRGLIGAKKAASNFSNMSMPEDVARKALHDAMRGKDMSVYSFYVKLCHAVAKILPQRMMIKIWLKQQKLS